MSFPITPTVYHRDKLRFLRLPIDSSWDFGITRALAVPALARLSYAFPGDDPIDEMISLIRRSSCQVKTLRCDDIAQPRDLVRLMPSLEEITLGMDSLDDVMLLDEFLERLSDPPPLDPTNDDHKAFLPCLRYLCFEGCQVFSYDRLYDMLSCSHRKSMVFKAFVVSSLVGTDDVALRLLRLVDEGVDLSIFLWDRSFGGGKREKTSR